MITNKKTGKFYIGQSKHIEKRFKEHCSQGKNKSYIDASIRKHGPDSFNFEIIYECPERDLLIEEEKFINLYGAYEIGYNLTRGGEHKRFGNPMNYPELRKKLSESLKGKKHSFERIEKASKSKSKAENKTGYYRVFKKHNSEYRLGYLYTYSYTKNGNQYSFSDISLLELEKKVKDSGLEWIIWDEETANKSLEENLNDLKNMRNPISLNTTGFYRVAKYNSQARNNMGYTFVYKDSPNNVSLSSMSIKELELKVKSKGLPWKITDEKLAKQTIEKNVIDLKEAELKPHGNAGRKWSDEELIMFSKINNTTGYYKVNKVVNEKLKIGYYFVYTHLENGKKKKISCGDLLELEERVKAHGFPWIIIDEKTASKTLVDNQTDLKNVNSHSLYKNNFSGYFGVTVQKCSSCKKGFRYKYSYYKGDKKSSLSSISFDALKKKVLDKGWYWKKLREENTIDLLSDDEIRAHLSRGR